MIAMTPLPSARSAWTSSWRRLVRAARPDSPAQGSGSGVRVRSGSVRVGCGSGPSGIRGRAAAFTGLGEVVPQAPVGDVDRVRGPGTGALGEAPPLSRQITSTPGCPSSQSRKLGVPALDQAQRPPVSMSMRGAVVMAPPDREVVDPGLRRAGRSGTGTAMTSRIIEPGRPPGPARRPGAPARPASATAIRPAPPPAAASCARTAGQARGLLGERLAPHPVSGQRRNRRTASRISTCCPPMAASESRRW